MTHPNHPQAPFNPQVYREAMGPGYGAALFKEQPGLTGQDLAARRSLPPVSSHRPLAPVRSRRPVSHRLLSTRRRILLALDHLLERSRHATQAQLTKLDSPPSVPTHC